MLPAWVSKRLTSTDCGLGIGDCGLGIGWIHPAFLNPRSLIRNSNPQFIRPSRLRISDLLDSSGILNPQSAIRNPQSSIRNPQSEIVNPQSVQRGV